MEFKSNPNRDHSSVVNDLDNSESITKATASEIFGSILLATPTWTIIRHPFHFTRYTTSPGAAIHYLYAAIGFMLLAKKWSAQDQDASDGGDAAPVIELINRVIGGLGPNAKIGGDDAIPVMILLGNIIGGFTAYFVCYWLARRRPAADTASPVIGGSPASQTLAATAYLGGSCSVIFALGLIAARGNVDAAPATVATGLILFLVYCWGTWIRNIHGVVGGRFLGILFPFVLALLSLAVFAGITLIIKLMLLRH